MQTENVDTQQPLQEEQAAPVAVQEEQTEGVAVQDRTAVVGVGAGKRGEVEDVVVGSARRAVGGGYALEDRPVPQGVHDVLEDVLQDLTCYLVFGVRIDILTN